jgi:rhodanese-related sulfurtransferase
MRRRTLLASSALAITATAGCFGGDEGGSTPDSTGNASYETTTVEGEEVPLAPIGDTYEWYENDEGTFADARGEGQYERAHIEGAVWSPAEDGQETDDPLADLSTDERIVCYCGCPHHLSALRASSLVADGYENVYVIDEGFGEWMEREYPVAGSEGGSRPSARIIRGRSDASFAGDAVFATHAPTDQREANFVGDDGGYELTLHFADVTDDSEIRVEAPDYTVVASLAELTSGVVTGS